MSFNFRYIRSLILSSYLNLKYKNRLFSLKKRNKIAIDLFSKKYRKRVVKAKKGKGSFIRKRKNEKVS